MSVGFIPVNSGPVPTGGLGAFALSLGAVAPASIVPLLKAKDPEIIQALYLLEQTQNLPQDEAYMRSLGVNLIFNNGRQALEVIRQRGASIEFGDIGDPKAHAAWSAAENKMTINQKYRGNMTLPVLYAIAASLYHEAGHAAWLGDNQSSIQEEIDCLALNVMAYRSHVAQNPQYLQALSEGPHRQLFEEGVALYPKLFFDPDPTKQALLNRIIKIYGDLDPESPDHKIPVMLYGKPLAERVVMELQRRVATRALSFNEASQRLQKTLDDIQRRTIGQVQSLVNQYKPL